jgi:hypothetical protein
MEFIVYKNGVELCFKAEGKIIPVETYEKGKYIKGSFVIEAHGLVYKFQSIIKEGDECVLKSDEKEVHGTYFSSSAIDRCPIIKETE